MNLFFVFMLRQVIQQATELIPHLRVGFPMALLLIGTLGVMLYYFWKFNQIAKG